MEDPTIRRRNRLRHHYTITSNVLLFGYRQLPDSAKLTYQVIDSFDWSDSAGVRKGFAYPSLGRLAEIRGVDERTIRRHLAQLERAHLVTRQERPGKPSLLIIEDPSAAETERYLENFVGVGEDKDVRPTPDRNVRPHLEEDQEQERQTSLTKVEDSSKQGEQRNTAPTIVRDLLKERVASLTKTAASQRSPVKARREHLAQEMLAVLRDERSLGYYRSVASRVPDHAIYEALGVVKEMAREGKLRKSKGALFVAIIRQLSRPSDEPARSAGWRLTRREASARTPTICARSRAWQTSTSRVVNKRRLPASPLVQEVIQSLPISRIRT